MYRLLIADDEQIECQALEHKIRHMIPDIMLLPSVHDGYHLLKCVQEQKPDIAIVDINMPGLSGLEAIEILQMKNIHLKIIINSSYSDFSYAQQAIRLGASDYLLKPGSKEALKNAIHKACQELDMENSQLSDSRKNEELTEALYKVTSEKWILSLIFDDDDQESFELLCEHIPQLRDGGYITVWKVYSSNSASRETFSLQEISTQIQEFCSCIGASHRDMYYLFLPVSEGSPHTAPESIRDLLLFVRNKFSASSIELSVGCSRYLTDISRYSNGIREAQAALCGQKCPGVSLFQYGREPEKTPLFPGLALKAAELLSKNAEEDCFRIIQKAFDNTNLQADFSDLEYLRAQAAILVVDIVWQTDEWLKERGLNFQQPLQWKILSQAQCLPEMKEWILLCIHDCHLQMRQTTQKENIYVQKAIVFIHENYNRDISLEEIAGELGISPFYLSRLFTQSKDFSFIELLTDVRIRRAIRLIREGAMSNREICDQIGYASITYFYRVFKKTTGMTVGEMRHYL